MHFFVVISQQCGAPIELVRDIEQTIGELFRRHAGQQRTTDVQVDIFTVFIGDQ